MGLLRSAKMYPVRTDNKKIKKAIFEIISYVIKNFMFYKNAFFLHKCECIRGFQKVVVSSGVENEIVSVWVKDKN